MTEKKKKKKISLLKSKKKKLRENIGYELLEKDKKVREERIKETPTVLMLSEKEKEMMNLSKIQEEIFKSRYKEEIGKEPLVAGRETTSYKDWKKVLFETIERSKMDIEEEKEKQAIIEKYEKETRKKAFKGKKETEHFKKWLIYIKEEEQVIEWQNTVSEVALEIAKEFPFYKIAHAITGVGGFEVHGYLQLNYEMYDQLIDSYVLDRACLFAKKIDRPEIIKFLKEYNIDDYKITNIELDEPIYFQSISGQEFRTISVMAPEYLEKAVTWITNYPWSIDGYGVRVTLAPCNLALIGFPMWDRPLTLLKDAPGKAISFMRAKAEAKELQNAQIEVQKKIIHQYRESLDPIEEKLDQFRRGKQHWKKLYSNLKDDIETKTPSQIMRELERMEKIRGGDDNKGNVVITVLLIIVIICIGVLSLVFISPTSFFDIPEQSTNSTSKDTFLFLLNLFQYLKIFY